MPAAIKIVEFRFSNRIVDVDRRNKQPVFLRHFVKAMHACCSFLRNAAPIFDDLMPAIGILTMNFEQQIFDDLLFPIRGFGFCPIAAFLELVAFVYQQGGVSTVVNHQLWTFAFWV